MIFISHTKKDKELVEPIARVLANIYGNDNVFYDSWSIQPGEDIIEKMNNGLEKCNYFFFFMSKNSLTSQMVKLEWQNILMKSSNNNNIKFIPVKIDETVPPIILLQKLYIDIYSYGIDVGLRQIIDVIKGGDISQPTLKKFENVEYTINMKLKNHIIINIFAKSYMEPISKFLILTDNAEDLSATVTGETMIISGINKDVELTSGLITNGYLIGVTRALTPSFPIEIELKSSKEIIDFKGILRQVSTNDWVSFPKKI